MESLTKRNITVGQHRIRVFINGPARPRTFVLVHGIGVSTRYYRPFMAEMAKTNHVVSVDLPGFGESSRPKKALTINGLAKVLGDCIGQLGLTNPVLVGHSMGCQVVAELMKQQPGLTDAAILMGPTVDNRHRNVLRHAWLLMVESTREPWRLNKIVFSDYLRCGVRHYMETLRPMLADHIERKLADNPARVLVMRGARDCIVPHKWVVQLVNRSLYGTLVEVPKAAHVLQFTRPKVVADICREFIRK